MRSSPDRVGTGSSGWLNGNLHASQIPSKKECLHSGEHAGGTNLPENSSETSDFEWRTARELLDSKTVVGPIEGERLGQAVPLPLYFTWYKSYYTE